MQKKLIIIFLAFIVLFGFIGCSRGNSESDAPRVEISDDNNQDNDNQGDNNEEVDTTLTISAADAPQIVAGYIKAISGDKLQNVATELLESYIDDAISNIEIYDTVIYLIDEIYPNVSYFIDNIWNVTDVDIINAEYFLASNEFKEHLGILMEFTEDTGIHEYLLALYNAQIGSNFSNAYTVYEYITNNYTTLITELAPKLNSVISDVVNSSKGIIDNYTLTASYSLSDENLAGIIIGLIDSVNMTDVSASITFTVTADKNNDIFKDSEMYAGTVSMILDFDAVRKTYDYTDHTDEDFNIELKSLTLSTVNDLSVSEDGASTEDTLAFDVTIPLSGYVDYFSGLTIEKDHDDPLYDSSKSASFNAIAIIKELVDFDGIAGSVTYNGNEGSFEEVYTYVE